MTIPQKCSQEFEELAETVVKELFKGSGAQITRTRRHKDGGYDIVAQYSDGSVEQKVYFECKLRSSNLNLRDIAANVIIAFNEGAVGLVALTNYDYTSQAAEQIGQFYQKTILNVKIIVGAEIKRIILKNNIQVSEDLLSILKDTSTMRKDTMSFLRIDLSKQNAYTQIFQKDPLQNQVAETFLDTLMFRESETALRQLQQGYTVLVSGYAGVGKSTFIFSVLNRCPCRQVHLDGALYTTQEQLLLELLMQIWGIPERFLIANLEEDHLNAISSRIGGEENDTETAQIIRSIVNPSNAELGHSIQYNYLICQYLLSLLNIHKNNTQYVFYLENIQFCRPEIFHLLVYLIKLLNKSGIGCVVEYKNGEYAVPSENELLPEIKHLERCISVNIDILDRPQALAYLKYVKPDLPHVTAKMILSLVGCRLYNLALTLNYLKQRTIDFDDPHQIAMELSALTPNDIPNIVSKTFPFYRQKYGALFDLMALLHGPTPLEFLSVVNVDDSEADELVNEQIVICKSGHIVPANEFVLREILHSIHPFRTGHRKIANSILAFTDKDPKQYQSARIYMLYHTERYENALTLLNQYIPRLRKERQYSVLIEYLDIAIDSAQKLKDYERYISFIVQQLDIMVLKKDISSPKAANRLNELSKQLSSRRVREGAERFRLAHDYFLGKRMFKLGCLSADEPAFQINKLHYEDCVSGRYSDNTEDWLGRVCCNYAIFVKETQGNVPALSIFQQALAALPDSFELQREYYSHEACMRLYDAPGESYSFYQKILNMFDRQPDRCALPFHERGDVAMSLLLSGQFDEAIRAAQESVELADSYGVWDEVGRITNIEGCAWLCVGDEQRAEKLFAESTSLMERSGYRLYCWRSRLNELQMKLYTPRDKQGLRLFLQRTYDNFKALLQKKVLQLVSLPTDEFVKTREYHALLVFGKCFRLMGDSEEETIVTEFGLEPIKGIYLGHIREITERPDHRAIKDSPYFCRGKIFMVG